MEYPRSFQNLQAMIESLGLTVQDGMIVFGVAFAFCLLIVIARPFHLKHTSRSEDLGAVQAAHSRPTPRIGGVAVLVAAVLAAMSQVDDVSALRAAFLVAVIPVFVAGLAEDLGIGASPRLRLIAAIVSSLAAVASMGVWIDRMDLPLLDAALSVPPVGIAFTLLCAAGFSHAFNLIDGVNGLASGMGVLMSIALGVIAYRAGLYGIAQFAFLLTPALMGFLVFNWPFGTVFLGDAGAYSLGHVFAWTAILIAANAPEVSAFALALVLFWPATDTVVSILRRRRAGRSPFDPDRLHFHQLVMRGLELSVLGKSRRHISNPATSAIMMPFVAAPIATGVLLWDAPGWAAVALLAYLGLFTLGYGYCVRFAMTRARHLQVIRRPARHQPGAGVTVHSPLSGVLVADGASLDIRISRRSGSPGWSVVTRDASGEDVAWSTSFASDASAWQGVLAALRDETMRGLSGPLRRRVR